MNDRTNKSWREQRKSVVMIDSGGKETLFTSVWQAANFISSKHQCLHTTARKEIRKSIKRGCPRYGVMWRWKDDETNDTDIHRF